MDRQRDWKLDPRLAENFANREERANNHNQELQARQGDIAAHGIERMGDVLSNGLKEGYQAYRQGKADRTQQNFDKIKYDRLRAEDEYWNGPWDGAGIGGTSSYGASGGNGGGASGDGGLGPNSLGNDGSPALGTIQQAGGGAPSGMAEDDMPRTVRLQPSRSFSPGAAAVLDGNAKPGFNPAVTGMQNPTTDYLQGKTSTPQYLGLNRPMQAPGAAGQPSDPATKPSQAPAPLGAGAGFGTAPADFASRQIVPRGTRYAGDPGKTRLQHKWDLGLIKSEEEINGTRVKNNAVWKDTGKFDAQGHPIRYNQVTGEYATDEGVTGAKSAAKNGAQEWRDTHAVDAQGRPIMFNQATGEYSVGQGVKVAPKKTGAAAGAKPQRIDTVDENGNPVQEFVIPTPGKRYPAKPAPAKAAKDLTAQERNSSMFYNNADTALKNLENMEANGFRPGASTAAKGLLPESVQGYAYTDDEQKYIQAAEDFTAAKLRLESGAAIPLSEIKQQSRIYMVRPGDSEAVIKQKQASRKAALEGLKFKAGRGADQIKAQQSGGGGIKDPEDMTPQERAEELKRLRGQ